MRATVVFTSTSLMLWLPLLMAGVMPTTAARLQLAIVVLPVDSVSRYTKSAPLQIESAFALVRCGMGLTFTVTILVSIQPEAVTMNRYATSTGAKVVLSRYSEMPPVPVPEGLLIPLTAARPPCEINRAGMAMRRIDE